MDQLDENERNARMETIQATLNQLRELRVRTAGLAADANNTADTAGAAA